MRVFFDASVIIAALLSKTGGSSLLFQYIQRKTITGITSQTVIEEVLEEDKPEKLNKSSSETEEFIAQSGLVVCEHMREEEVVLYKDKVNIEDAHLFAGAYLTNCTHLVSLDKKHVLKADIQKLFLPLRVVSPKQLLEEIVKTVYNKV